MKITTQEIRDGERRGGARIVWREINELKSANSCTRKGYMILKAESGNTQSATNANIK